MSELIASESEDKIAGASPSSRQRLQAALDYRQPDCVCVDFGATFVTGMHVSIVHRLRQRVLGEKDYRVKVIEPCQMLGEVRERIDIFNREGGMVFNTVHNIPGNVPIGNVEAMFKAIHDSAQS